MVITIYNLIEYNESYSETPEIFWQYCRDKPALDADGDTADFNAANAAANSIKIKEKITDKTGNNDTKDVT